MTRHVEFDALGARVGHCSVPVKRGKVTAAGETVIDAVLPGSRIGMRVSIERPGQPHAMTEVAFCDGSRVKLLPLSRAVGIGPGDAVLTLSYEDTIPSGEALLGRIIDPLGRPVDGGPTLADLKPWSVDRAAPDPLARVPVDTQLVTGVRVIDGCLSLGLGQRIGLFAGPGLGKSMLLGSLARNAECDVSVICLVGERGREVREFLDRSLGPFGLAQSVIILAPPDSPPLLRAKALGAATAVAEWFRAAGKRVLLLVDSLTRAVRARRDVALALGEAPTRGGYPASAFASLPSVLERAGCDASGSITAVYTVLTEKEEGDPVAEEARSLLDGHIVLSSKLAGAGHWPAIDIVRSVSRVMSSVVAPKHLRAAQNLRRLLGAYAEHEDLIMMGAYRQGASKDTDLALDRKTEIASFTRQELSESSSIESTLETLFVVTRDL